ncbi:colanic acid exporter [Clostridium thermopalmarium DSM 5974]|uniref:Colanic acid exporter n=2 Tax=Clostridium TaxID=1485 RepID=A0A151ARD5_9CLOT|nr:flippase [Clostridium thermopalmarium]KYH30140.1 colanic acid exporter [Clostridium colicanis DSM 13634]PRR75448.1 colanic acid exporter [Clostridium thermopalmarium DSM 5974]PVZ24350.1 O-antigen/teichoic acid export membrane protein [Clostridium thermopalmarium DSM 5974]
MKYINQFRVVKEIKNIAKNFLSIGTANIVSQFLTFLVIAYYARILGVDKFGQISLAQSILTYFTMFTLFGFQTLGIKEVSKNQISKENLAGNIIFIRLICALIGFLIMVLIGCFTNKGIDFKGLMAIYGLTLFPLAFNIDWFYFGTKEMQYNAIYNVLKSAFPFILTIIFLKNKNQIYLIPAFMVIGMAAASAFHAYVFYKVKKLKYKPAITVDKVKFLILNSLPFLLSALLSLINGNIDSIIIGFVRTDRELGLYSSAYKVIYFLINLIAIIFTPFFPILIELFHNNNLRKLKNTVDDLWKIITMIAYPMLVGGILLSKQIIILLFGEEFKEGHIVFCILLIYAFILFLRENYGYSLNAWDREKSYLKIVTISAVVNAILNLILIPFYGINAAAITTVLSEIINFALMKKEAEKVIRVSYLKYFVKLSPAIILMCAQILIFKYTHINVIINIITAVIIYFISLMSFKYISKDEIVELMKRK